MQTLRYEIDIPIGAYFEFFFDISDENGTAEDFAGKTAALKLQNISKSPSNKDAIVCSADCIELEPDDSEGNTIKGRILFKIKSEYTQQLEIPDSEKDPYGESGYYAIAQVSFDDGQIPIILKVRPIKTI